MNRKYRAKFPNRLAATLSLTACLMSLSVTADVGDRTQQLHIQQAKSRFQLMLEQVRESVRHRAAAARTAAATRAGPAMPIHLGGRTQSVRLASVTVTDPVSSAVAPETTRRFRAWQAYERDQQRILDYRQLRQALIAGRRTGGLAGEDSFRAKRRELVRYKKQIQRQSLQRKLRR